MDDTRSESEPAYVARARTDVVRGSLWTVAASILSIPLGFVASVIVARSLAPAGLGRFATYVAVFAVVQALTNLGWSEATVQWLASATAREAQNERITLIRACAGFHVFIAGPLLGLCAFILLSPAGISVAAIGLLSVWMTQSLGTGSVILTSAARNATSARIALVSGTAVQAGVITAALASHRPGVTWVAQLSLLLLGSLLTTLALDHEERKALLRPRLYLRVPRGFWTYAISACIGGLVSGIVFGRSEIFALRANGYVAVAGMFTIVTGLASQMTGPLDSALAPLTPIAAGLVAIDRERAQRVFRRSLRVSAIIGTVAASVLLPIGVVLIAPVYGAKYGSVASTFVVLGLVSAFQTVVGPLTAFAFAIRSAGQILRVNVMCLAVDAALAFSLVPEWHIWGAVAANATAQTMSLIWMTRLVSRRFGVPLNVIVSDLKVFAIGITLGGVEAVVSLQLRGLGRLGVVGIVFGAVTIMRALLVAFPQLALGEEDVRLITTASPSRVMGAMLYALNKTGYSRG